MRLRVTTSADTDLPSLRRAAGERLGDLPIGARVALSMPSGAGLAAALLETFDRGLVAVPLDPWTDPRRREFLLAHSQASRLLTADETLSFEGGPPSPPEDRLIVYTSGTTGDPKGVVLTDAALAHNADAAAALHGFGDSPHFSPLPLFHVNALCMSLLGCSRSSGELILSPRFDPVRDFAVLNALGAGTASLVPALLRQLVDACPPWPRGLRYIITAAAPLSQGLARRFYDAYGPRLRQGYGLSESTNFSCLTPLLDSAAFRLHYLENQPPVGRPIHGTEVRIVEGEVHVRGDSLMKGYWCNPEATARAFDHGWLKTGDLGTFRDGLLVLRGRQKELVLRGGESISPLEVEESFGLPVLVVGAVASDALGEDIGAVAPPSELEAFIEALGRVAPRRRPRFVAFESPLTTPVGKFRRAAMFASRRTLDFPAAPWESLASQAERAARDQIPRPATVFGAIGGPALETLVRLAETHETFGYWTVRSGDRVVATVYWGRVDR